MITKYYNATTTEWIYHVVLIEDIEDGYSVYEGNYIPNEEGRRKIPKDSKEIVGFFDVELWKIINKLSPQLKAILEDESNFNHYKIDGSVLKGSSGEYGIAQFKRKTWNWFNKLRVKQGLPNLYDILSPYEQIEMLEWAEQNNLLEHWSCVKEKRCPNISRDK